MMMLKIQKQKDIWQEALLELKKKKDKDKGVMILIFSNNNNKGQGNNPLEMGKIK